MIDVKKGWCASLDAEIIAFLERLARPHFTDKDLVAGYMAMGLDAKCDGKILTSLGVVGFEKNG